MVNFGLIRSRGSPYLGIVSRALTLSISIGLEEFNWIGVQSKYSNQRVGYDLDLLWTLRVLATSNNDFMEDQLDMMFHSTQRIDHLSLLRRLDST